MTVISYRPSRATARSPLLDAIARVGVALVGVQFWLLVDNRLVRPPLTFYTLLPLLLLSFLPALQVGLLRLSRWLDRRGSVAMPARFALVSLVSGVVLYVTALAGGRPFLPAIHDEFSYLLQARMFAEGHLWLPPHPLAQFFDSFYVITDRAYASQYFPGTALLLVPGVWLGLPFWFVPLVVASAFCGALFLLLRELFDGLGALVGVGIALGTMLLRYLSIAVFSLTPTVLFGTLALWAIVRWDATRRRRLLWFAGACLGWCAITRPLDAVAYATCAAALVAIRMRLSAWRGVGPMALATLPFLALQLVINHGVTGFWFETSFGYYAARDMPGSEVGFRAFDPALKPVSPLPQKQLFYDRAVRPILEAHTFTGRLIEWRDKLFRGMLLQLLADAWYVIVVPAIVLVRQPVARWIVAALLPLWWVLYLFHPFTYGHYQLAALPAACVIVLAGAEAFRDRVVPRRARRVAGAFLPLAIVALSLLSFPGLRLDTADELSANGVEKALRDQLAALPAGERRIVLCRFDRTSNPELEIVYNLDRARIDDNPTIRAHDLGDDRNRRLFDYYAASAPDRIVYRFDRADASLTRLGRVADLAAADRPATSPTTRSLP